MGDKGKQGELRSLSTATAPKSPCTARGKNLSEDECPVHLLLEIGNKHEKATYTNPRQQSESKEKPREWGGEETNGPGGKVGVVHFGLKHPLDPRLMEDS